MNNFGGHSWLVRILFGGCLLCSAWWLMSVWYMAKVTEQMLKPVDLPKQQAQQEVLDLPEQPSAAKAQPVELTQVALPSPPPLPITVEAITVEKKSQKTERNSIQIEQIKVAQIGPKPQIKSQQQPKPSVNFKPPQVVDVSIERQVYAEPLLQLIEAGKGPNINIAWPRNSRGREVMFKHLTDCLGVGIGVYANESVTPIYGPRLAYSQLVRMVQGQLAESEARLHRVSGVSGVAVRMFPRQLDASLLAGLSSLAPKSFEQHKLVRGMYKLEGRNLYVEQLSFDGRPLAGRVLLSRGECYR